MGCGLDFKGLSFSPTLVDIEIRWQADHSNGRGVVSSVLSVVVFGLALTQDVIHILRPASVEARIAGQTAPKCIRAVYRHEG